MKQSLMVVAVVLLFLCQVEGQEPATQDTLQGWVGYWQPRFGQALKDWTVVARFGDCKSMPGGCLKSVGHITWHAKTLTAEVYVLRAEDYAEAYPKKQMHAFEIEEDQYATVVHELMHLTVRGLPGMNTKSEEELVECMARALISGDAKSK